ncbi:MAG: hypothetical protein J0M00_05020 [Burkholderiales bacterium]|nr:hypothetical protein [Burkholderiales bacterium]
MSDPVAAREALIIEAIGEAASLIESVERLAPEIQERGREFDRASVGLRNALAAFDAEVTALAEKAKVQVAKHILARTEEAARRSIDLQARAMADAARVAFGGELGATVQRLRSAIQPLIERQERRWETWLTHAAAAAAGSAVTLALTVWLGAQ